MTVLRISVHPGHGSPDDGAFTTLSRWAWLPVVVVASIVTVAIAISLLTPTQAAAIGIGRGDTWWALAFLALWLLAAVLARQGRDRGLNGFVAVAAAVLITLLLGLVSFGVCSGGHLWVSAITATLQLFMGSVADGDFGPTRAGVCSATYPLALELARLCAVAAVFTGAVVTFMAVWRRRLNLFRARVLRRVDVVVGLNPEALPLITGLIADQRASAHEAPWHTPSWREQRRVSTLHRRSGVYVVHENPDDPLLGEAEALGAKVVIGRVTDATVWRSLAVRHRLCLLPTKEVSLNRLFAVSTSSRANKLAVAAALNSLGSRGLGIGRTVPRLVARFDDPREADAWRLDTLRHGPHAFVDAISSERLLARVMVQRLITAKARSVIIAGDSALVPTLLDELSLRRYFRLEEDEAASARSGADGPGSDMWDPTVILAGPHSDGILREWRRHAAPAASLPHPMEVRRDPDDWEAVADRWCADEGTAGFILAGDPARQASAIGMRISRMHTKALVFIPDDRIDGLGLPSDEPLIPGDWVFRYGPTVTLSGGVPDDSWVVLARQSHNVHRAGSASLRAARREWPVEPSHQGDELPEFFREDTLRQLRTVLSELDSRGYSWVPVTITTPVLPLPSSLILELAEQEHRRWADLRLSDGWTTARPASTGDSEAKALADERARRNPNLLAWTTLSPLKRPPDWSPADQKALECLPTEGPDSLRDSNAETIRQILVRLVESGLAPVREDGPQLDPSGEIVLRKIGQSWARKLEQPTDWTNSARDRMDSKAGDWEVRDYDRPRVVDEVEFRTTYTPVDGPTLAVEGNEYSLFRRVGTVRARFIDSDEAAGSVSTLEGEATVQVGMWVLTSEQGNRWPVTTATILRGYEVATDIE